MARRRSTAASAASAHGCVVWRLWARGCAIDEPLARRRARATRPPPAGKRWPRSLPLPRSAAQRQRSAWSAAAGYAGAQREAVAAVATRARRWGGTPRRAWLRLQGVLRQQHLRSHLRSGRLRPRMPSCAARCAAVARSARPAARQTPSSIRRARRAGRRWKTRGKMCRSLWALMMERRCARTAHALARASARRACDTPADPPGATLATR